MLGYDNILSVRRVGKTQHLQKGGFMKYNFQRLKGRIKDFYPKQEDFAKELNISDTALNNKLNNRSKFSFDEIYKVIELLHIAPEDISTIFFNAMLGNDNKGE